MDLATSQFKNEIRVAYTRACKLIPTYDAEIHYIELAKNGNLAARNLLFEKQLPALLKLAKSISYQAYTGNCAELVASVMSVMDGAINDFDTSSGNRFWTFLRARAMNAMNKEKYGDLLVHLPENYIKENRVNELAHVESGDAPVAGSGDRSTVFDTIRSAHSNSDEIFEASRQHEFSDITGTLLSVLDPVESKIIIKCFFESQPQSNDGQVNLPWSTSALAAHIGTTKEYINRKRKQALQKMKTRLDEERDWCINTDVI